jgi:phosphoribosylamine--glycine ligase
MDEIAAGVVMAIPPYPHHIRDYDDVLGIPVWGVDPGELGDYHPCELCAGKEPGTLASAGDYLLVATGTGMTVKAAVTSAEKALGKVSAPASPFWRIDIGRRLRKQLPELQAFGYARGMAYS